MAGRMISIKDLAEDIKLPERVVLFDNGAYDLEQNGKSGFYTWVGYKHKGSRSEPRMDQIVSNVAYEIAELWSSRYAAKAVVQDYIRSLDAYRVYIQVSTT